MNPTNFVSLWHLKAHEDAGCWEKLLKINFLKLFFNLTDIKPLKEII